MRFILVILAILATPAFAQNDGQRGGSNEFSLHLVAVGPKHYTFDGGATARNDGGGGIGLALARNLNNYFAVGLEATVSQWDYRAGVAPGAGNAGAGFDSEGTMETGVVRLNLTWNLLARRLTPFVTAGAGAMILDANLDSAPPANACWVYPWYGQVCGATAPNGTLVRFTYGAGVGMRLDLPDKQGFLRVMAAGEWIELSEASSAVGYWQMRADFGLKF